MQRDALPRGFILKTDERPLFVSPKVQCHLPVAQTKTYGFGGGFIGAESDARTVTDNRGYGSLVITSQRIVVHCKSDVREWLIASIVSASSRKSFMGSHLELAIANHGAARFFWTKPDTAESAEQAIQTAIAESDVAE